MKVDDILMSFKIVLMLRIHFDSFYYLDRGTPSMTFENRLP